MHVARSCIVRSRAVGRRRGAGAVGASAMNESCLLPMLHTSLMPAPCSRYSTDSVMEKHREERKKEDERRERKRVPHGHWKKAENRKQWVEEMASEMGIEGQRSSLAHWQHVKTSDVRQRQGGGSLLNHFRGSLLALLLDTYPHLQEEASSPDVLATTRGKVPKGHWRLHANRRALFDRLARQHGVQCDADWARVTYADVVAAGGASVLRMFSSSLHAALQDAYPERQLEELVVRSSLPRGHWEKAESRLAFMEEAAKRYGVEKAEDWRRVQLKDMHAMRGGASFMKRYSYSLMAALRDVYPHRQWDAAECREKLPQNYWGDVSHVRRFLEEVADKRHVKQPGDWRRILRSDIVAMGGVRLLERYGSLGAALGAAFPEEKFDIDVCRPSVRKEHWQEAENVRSFLLRVQEELSIGRKKDWSRVSAAQVRELGGGSLLGCMSLAEALQVAFPKEGPWEEVLRVEKGAVAKRSAQRQLFLRVSDILADQPRQDVSATS